jgi:hypothetical protein
MMLYPGSINKILRFSSSSESLLSAFLFVTTVVKSAIVMRQIFKSRDYRSLAGCYFDGFAEAIASCFMQ